MKTVRIEGLMKSYGYRFRLGPVFLDLEPGEILGIAGPKDSGKTTLLKILWGFLRPDTGIVHVFGVRPHLNQISVRLRAGYLSAESTFY